MCRFVKIYIELDCIRSSPEVMNKVDHQKAKIEFVKLYGNEVLTEKWEDYAQCISSYGKEAVDAFVQEFGIHLLDLSNFEDSFLGEYASKKAFLEHLIAANSWELPDFLVVEWDLSFDNREEVFCNGFVFSADF